MRRRTFLASPLAASGAWAGAARARTPRAISITANLRAPHGEIARLSRYGVYDPLCLASAHAGGALLCAALYEGLYRRNGRGLVQNGLVRETRADRTRKRWTLRLAAPQGGTAVDAQRIAQRLAWVFAHSAEIKEDPGIEAPTRAMVAAYGAWITTIEARDASTLQIEARTALPYLSAVLAEPTLRIPLSAPDAPDAVPGDGPLYLAEIPDAYRLGAQGHEVSGTFFDLLPRSGARLRTPERGVELIAMRGARARGALVGHGRTDVALDLKRAETGRTTRVLRHTLRWGIGAALKGNLRKIRDTSADGALERLLSRNDVLRSAAPYGTREKSSAPATGLRCENRPERASREEDARALATITSTVRCAGAPGYEDVARKAVEVLRGEGIDARVGASPRESEIVFGTIYDNADPRLSALRIWPFPGSRQSRGRATYPPHVRDIIVRMMRSRTPAQARPEVCALAQWNAERHPWMMLGWVRSGTALGPRVEHTARAKGARWLDLDELVERWRVR